MRCFALACLLLGACLGPAAPVDMPSSNPPASGPMLDGGDAPDGGVLDGASSANDLAPSGPCASVTCSLHAHCEAALCVCDIGFALQGGSCKASAVPDPATHTEAEVCGKYTASAAVPASFFSKTATTCDAGVLTADGIASAVARVSFHRWLVGLAPVAASASGNAQAQKCALVSAWNPAGVQAHNPSPSAQCYTAEGAQGAGSSNIAWGSNDPVDAIDQWIDDQGNATTMGHRRWILNPPLDPVGFGMYVGGDAGYGSAACLQIFSSQGTGPRPDFVAYPPPGPVPLALTRTTWTFSGDGFNFTSPTVTVTRMSDGANLAITMQPVQNPGGFNYPSATSWQPDGWMPVAGQTYRVAITAGTKSATYDVKPVTCP